MNTQAQILLTQIDELPCLRIQHPKASALIALQGAQVLEYTPAGAEPVIWLSETAGFKGGQSVRGGIPVCWPWFGDLKRNPAEVQRSVQGDPALAHGWVRNQPWLLEHTSIDADAARIRLRYPTPLGLGSPWAAQVSLTLDILVGAELNLQLTTVNWSDAPITYSQALHSYFAVSQIDKVQVLDLDQCRYIDTLQQWRECADADPLAIRQETDRIYLDTPATIRLLDLGWQRIIHINSDTSRSAVVWNPWIEKSARLSHFADDAWQRMLCIETARVLDDCVTLPPGEQDTLRLNIGLSAPA